MSKAVFLDRDGVINHAYTNNKRPIPPSTIEELIILPKVAESLILLKSQGFKLIVVTNQPDVSRGKTSKETVELINSTLLNKLPIDKFYTCYHDSHHLCDCRKPKPGLLIQASTDYNIDAASSFLIGDRRADILAGNSFGCKTFFIDYDYAEEKPVTMNYVSNDLWDATQRIIILSKVK
jgi:D-glycero-D-manno-heptose 1,7-bisphosphate phosphatase